MRVELTVNGELREAEVWAGDSLLTALRDRLDLPGSKNACEQGECGSCSVLLDGTLVCSCLVLAAQADGHEVVTVEGLADGDGNLHPVQEAFADAGAVQCGFCTPGFVVAGRPPAAGSGARRAHRPRALSEQTVPVHRLPEDPRCRIPCGRTDPEGEDRDAAAHRVVRARGAMDDVGTELAGASILVRDGRSSGGRRPAARGPSSVWTAGDGGAAVWSAPITTCTETLTRARAREQGAVRLARRAVSGVGGVDAEWERRPPASFRSSRSPAATTTPTITCIPGRGRPARREIEAARDSSSLPPVPRLDGPRPVGRRAPPDAVVETTDDALALAGRRSSASRPLAGLDAPHRVAPARPSASPSG
jgi:carbon-monoxide dehydrogenase small subunit